MKKILTVLLVAALAVVLAVSASAELYNPNYYAALKVEEGAITVDGAVDEAYGEPIFYFVSDGTDSFAGDYTSVANWFFTKATGDKDDVLALVLVEENYAKGYAVWTDSALYVCIDTNILGWDYPAGLPAGSMWMSFCTQLGMFDFKSGDNVDWGMAINESNETLQTSFGQNKNTSDKQHPTLKNGDNGMTDLNCKVTRDGSHVIYEVELPFVKVLSSIPKNGDSMGLDVCINFGEASVTDGKGSCLAQKCLTFVNDGAAQGYHSRDINNARPLYFVTSQAEADQLYADKVNASEVAKDDHSISLFGCNEVPAGTNFTLDTENKKAGFASLLLIVKPGEQTINRFTLATPVDGTGYDTLEFDMYVSDLAIFDAQLGSNQLEITSSGKADEQEINWTVAQIKAKNQGSDLVVGWNHIVLPLSSANPNAAFDISNINFIGFYMVSPEIESSIAIQFDNFRLTDAQAVLEADAKEAAAKMDNRIEQLTEITADNYTSMKIKVQGARAVYDKLSDLEKSFVSADMLKKLETAEAAIVEFENTPVEPENPTDPGTDDKKPGEDDNKPADDDKKPADDTKTDDESGNTTLIIVIVVVAVVVIAGVVVLLVVRKKKK